jgi:transcriptional regulator with XRE-family HTH domain
MDAVRVGRVIRALRIRKQWRQVDLAERAGCSQALIARIEAGGADRLTGATLERVAHALGARLFVRVDWNGAAADRLLDADHAAVVNRVIAILRSAGWECVPELTFAIYGERGSIDVLAWHESTRTSLVVEVKSIVADVQGTLAPLDRKERLAPRLARDRGWNASRVAVILVIASTATARRRIAMHAATFGARFPDRAVAIRRFIWNPAAYPPVRGVWFLSVSTIASARERVNPRSRAPGA